MAAKRAATTELNHDNWNEENEPEPAGTFAKATEDILEKRVIKTAKRRLPVKDENAKSAFGSFMGFKNSTSTSASPFSFLAGANTTSSTLSSSTTVGGLAANKLVTTNGAAKNSENGAEKSEETSKRQAISSTSTMKQGSVSGAKDDEKIFKKSSDYFAKLKGLNESVAQWIKTHVDANPFCMLTPIFRDYERYLKDIESKREEETVNASKVTMAVENTKQETKNVSSTPSLFGGTSTKSLGTEEQKMEKSIFSGISSNTKLSWGKTDQQTDAPKSIFGNVEHKLDASKSIFSSVESKSDGKNIFGTINPEKNPFLSKPSVTSDNKSADDNDTKTNTKPATTLPFSSANLGAATFSFGQSSTTSTASAGFSFGSSKPFSFGTQVVQPSTESEDKGDAEGKEDEDDEPPKAEFKPVTEDGAVHEQRCKVFVKKDGSFADRGVGRLFLKPTPNEKTQLIVRADTSLGNLLINTLLTESIPTKRLNKNTIMLVCLPMPDFEPPPVAVLLRVKTSEDADILLEALNKHKK